MSAVSAIYSAPILQRRIPKNNWGTTYITIKYDGKKYQGRAYCHHDDKDIFSERVGTRIALSRARIMALEDAYEKADNISIIKTQLYKEVTEFGKANTLEVDPTGRFWKNALNSMRTAAKIRIALLEEKATLKKYLKELDTFAKKIRKQRAKENKKP